jgi:hypothetical protein
LDREWIRRLAEYLESAECFYTIEGEELVRHHLGLRPLTDAERESRREWLRGEADGGT